MSKNGHAESGNIRFLCLSCKRRTTNMNQGDTKTQPFDPVRNKTLKEAISNGARKFVITSASNNTNRFKSGWESLQRYCEFTGAELAVIPVHYKNISLYQGNQSYDKFWPKELEPYLITEKIYLGGKVQLMGNINIAATAANPLSSLSAIGGDITCIYGHPQLAMEPVAAPASKRPKRVWTTGSISIPSYSDTKLGAMGAFHHVMSALVVEVNDRETFVRVLSIDHKGEFYDLDIKCTPKKYSEGHRVTALATGDEHVKFMLPSVKKATYTEYDSLAKLIRPKYIYRNDLLDWYAGSHHHERDPVLMFQKFHKGDNDGRKELDQALDHLAETTPKGCINRIVSSNHHDHLDQWIRRTSIDKDHVNAMLLTDLKKWVRESALKGENKSAMQLYFEKNPCGVPVEFLDRNKPCLHNGVDYSQHGDVGVNGSRGSARGIAKTTYKATIGHSHGARIVRSVFQAGTSTGRLGYENGMSDHTNTHVIHYPNGKRTIVDIINGRFRQ
jgi:hypothetical protein